MPRPHALPDSEAGRRRRVGVTADRQGASRMATGSANHSRHVQRTSREAGEETCEKAAITAFTARTKTLGCDPCTDLSRVAAAVERAIEGTSQQLYCAGAATSASVCLTCACGSYRCDNAQLSDVRTT